MIFNIFVEEGLEQRLLHLGKKPTSNGIYRGHKNVASYLNYNDSYGVKKFKSRALKHNEDFNRMTKKFVILSQRCQHGVQKVAMSFEIVSVICQYKIETSNEPLFDALIVRILSLVTCQNLTDDNDK